MDAALPIGCGTGYLLGRLAARAPQAEALAGIDAAPAMIAVARGAATDDRLRFVVGMDLAESAACLRHHLALAGREEPLSADDAIARLHRVANGLIRTTVCGGVGV